MQLMKIWSCLRSCSLEATFLTLPEGLPKTFRKLPGLQLSITISFFLAEHLVHLLDFCPPTCCWDHISIRSLNSSIPAYYLSQQLHLCPLPQMGCSCWSHPLWLWKQMSWFMDPTRCSWFISLTRCLLRNNWACFIHNPPISFWWNRWTCFLDPHSQLVVRQLDC